MGIASLVKDYLAILIWPGVVLALGLVYRKAITSRLELSSVSLELFGVKVETTLEKLEHALTKVWRQDFDQQQWQLLEDIHHAGAVSVLERNYQMGAGGDLEWIRPLRNAGLLITLPDGYYIEQAEQLVLSPLGQLLMDEREKR